MNWDFLYVLDLRPVVAYRARAFICVFFIAAITPVATSVRADAHNPTLQLWLYYSTNLLANKNIMKLERRWPLAVHDGYSYILLADSKFDHMQLLGSARKQYVRNVRRVLKLAARLHLTLVPAICPIGYSNDLLAVNPSLAAGVPVRNVPFIVRDGVASVAPDPSAHLPALPTWMDRDVHLSHGVALISKPAGDARLVFKKQVHPFWAYHIRVWIKTARFSGHPHIEVLAGPHHRELQYEDIVVRRSQPWHRYDVVFDALSYRHVAIYLGSWGTAGGVLAWRKWSMHVAGLVNPLSRPGAPTTVAGFKSGTDFTVPQDTKLGRDPYPGDYTSWHRPVLIHFLCDVPNGTMVHVSWFYPPIIYSGEVCGSLNSAGFLHLLVEQTRAIRALFHSRHYMLNIDELRVLGWEDDIPRQNTPGEILARSVRMCRRWLPGDRIYTWGDMFNPYHNARRKYYLVNGSLVGSWRGLGRRTIVFNWDSQRMRRSLIYFAHRGNRQIIAAYYDAPLNRSLAWLRAARGVKGVLGMMYTTWRGDYRQMGVFAKLVRQHWR